LKTLKQYRLAVESPGGYKATFQNVLAFNLDQAISTNNQAVAVSWAPAIGGQA